MVTCFIILISTYQGQPATVQECFSGEFSVGKYVAVGVKNVKVFKFDDQLNKYNANKVWLNSELNKQKGKQ